MIPSCFSNPNKTLSSTTSHHHLPDQNLITCIYQTHLFNSPTYLTLTWSKTLSSHSLSLNASDSFSVTISLLPPTFSFFKTRPGSKSIHLNRHKRLKLYWDFTRAKFAAHNNSPEPESCFYIAVACNGRVEFFLGDMYTELTRPSGLVMTSQLVEPTLLSRREHVFGRKTYACTTNFLGSKYEIEIACSGGALVVKVDGVIRLLVKRLAWKFRGNERISFGGVEAEFFWDVFNWVNERGNSNCSSSSNRHGVFIFQVGDGAVWPEIVGPEKKLMRKSVSSSSVGPASTPPPGMLLSPSPSYSSVLQWAEESSDCGRSSSSSSTTRSCGSNGAFSLVLYAWRTE